MSREQRDISKKLINSSQEGTFLEYAAEASKGGQQQRNQVVDVMTILHNAGDLDLPKEFKQLENKAESGRDFFQLRHLFEKALPRLEASVLSIMECVQHLVKEAGEDLSAGMLIPPFIEFCKYTPTRESDALEIVLLSPEQWSDLLAPILVAGTYSDMQNYFQKAAELSFHKDVAIRRNAVHAIGQFKFPAESGYSGKSLDCFAKVIEDESDDQVLACLLGSACSICIGDNSTVDRGREIIEAALSKGGELTLYSAASVFGFEMKKLPEEILDVFFQPFLKVDPKHAGTLSNIGYGISCLLKREDPGKGIDLLENLLLGHHGKLTIESLDHLIHSIHSQGFQLLNTLLTRWFLNGEPVLCNSIASILETIHGEEPLLKIDRAVIPSEEPALYLFLARKAIGYLFMKPVTCTSIIVSLMENNHEEELLQDLGRLLFDPILLNFCGKPYDFLKKEIAVQKDPVRNVIQTAMDAIDGYLETLRSVPDIPEMYPTQEQREVHTMKLLGFAIAYHQPTTQVFFTSPLQRTEARR